jgi:hypothetical protein
MLATGQIREKHHTLSNLTNKTLLSNPEQQPILPVNFFSFFPDTSPILTNLPIVTTKHSLLTAKNNITMPLFESAQPSLSYSTGTTEYLQ